MRAVYFLWKTKVIRRACALFLAITTCGVAVEGQTRGNSSERARSKIAKQIPDINDQRIQDRVKALHLPSNSDSSGYAQTYLCEELSKLGEKALSEKDYDFAREVYAQYLKVKPHDAAAQYGLGLSFLKQKRFREARREFERLAANSQKGDRFLSAIDALILEKRYADADAVTNALDLYGRDTFYHVSKSRILAAQGKQTAAIAEAQLAVRVLRMNGFEDKLAVQQVEKLGARVTIQQKTTDWPLFSKVLSLFEEIGRLKDKPTNEQLRALIQQRIGPSCEVKLNPHSSFSGEYSKVVLFLLSSEKTPQYPLLSMNTSALVQPMPIKMLLARSRDYKSHYYSNHSNSKNASARIDNLFITWMEQEGKLSADYLSCYWKEKPQDFFSLSRTTTRPVKPPPEPDPDALLKEGEAALKVRKFALAKKKLVSAVTNWNGKHGQIQLQKNKARADRIRQDFKLLFEMQDDLDRARYFELASLHQIQEDSFAVESLPGKNYPTAAEFMTRHWQVLSDDDCLQVINDHYFNLMIVKESPFFEEVLKIVGKHPRFSSVNIKPLGGSLVDRIEAAEFGPSEP
jgi:tetratricopeptide (TPR) repeat protein